MTAPRKDIDPAHKARGLRNIALGLGLAAFVVLVFVVTLVKLGGNLAQPHF
ncbi:hypothetical protein PMI01_02765 [Caulobacter sp. AP07]|jgi:hypothetical protein|uniref:hypothetical protein n=1 Tax=Caulobacter sp. AP07 TaxID=1144304 RepID=UPI0002721B2D|nr:hypothetical protein [Caulobacter sp. AP07]EJL31527.1 hypothetical protein PMI01_02765 [Caulobacter sp. AP07]